MVYSTLGDQTIDILFRVSSILHWKAKTVDTAGRIESSKRNTTNLNCRVFKTILLSIMKPTILVGGQAVIEGVMMRVPGAYATAVRDPNGKIHVEKKKYSSIGSAQHSEKTYP